MALGTTRLHPRTNAIQVYRIIGTLLCNTSRLLEEQIYDLFLVCSSLHNRLRYMDVRITMLSSSPSYHRGSHTIILGISTHVR
jgi:hypothetical protein